MQKTLSNVSIFKIFKQPVRHPVSPASRSKLLNLDSTCFNLVKRGVQKFGKQVFVNCGLPSRFIHHVIKDENHLHRRSNFPIVVLDQQNI